MKKTSTPGAVAQNQQEITPKEREVLDCIAMIRNVALKAGLDGRPIPTLDWSEVVDPIREEYGEVPDFVFQLHDAIDQFISDYYNQGKEIASKGRRQADG